MSVEIGPDVGELYYVSLENAMRMQGLKFISSCFCVLIPYQNQQKH